MYIALFKDNTMTPVAMHPEKKDFQKGTRFFDVVDTVTILELSRWYAQGNPTLTRITEIDGK